HLPFAGFERMAQEIDLTSERTAGEAPLEDLEVELERRERGSKLVRCEEQELVARIKRRPRFISGIAGLGERALELLAAEHHFAGERLEIALVPRDLGLKEIADALDRHQVRDARADLLSMKRLDDEVLRAFSEELDAKRVVRACGEDHDRRAVE